MNFKSAVEDYIAREQKGRRGNITADEVQRSLLKACAEWHHRPIATLRIDEIDKLLCSIRDGVGPVKGPYSANKVFAELRTFFNWCCKPNIAKLKSSPMLGLDKPFTKEKSRDRVYSDDEIRLIWRTADQLGGVDGRFLKMLLLTGKRKSALAEMMWEEIDDTWFWNAPKSENKNKRLHPIPLPPLAQRVLGPKQKQGYVFPGPVERTHYSDEDNILHRKVRRREPLLADFFPHALRHTAETKCAALGILPHIRDLLFDHASARGAGAGYDHYAYGQEMRAAMEAWADHIGKLVTPEGAALLR
jgi:integrase